VEGAGPGGGPRGAWREIVEEDCGARALSAEDAVVRGGWGERVGMIDGRDEC